MRATARRSHRDVLARSGLQVTTSSSTAITVAVQAGRGHHLDAGGEGLPAPGPARWRWPAGRAAKTRTPARTCRPRSNRHCGASKGTGRVVARSGTEVSSNRSGCASERPGRRCPRPPRGRPEPEVLPGGRAWRPGRAASARAGPRAPGTARPPSSTVSALLPDRHGQRGQADRAAAEAVAQGLEHRRGRAGRARARRPRTPRAPPAPRRGRAGRRRAPGRSRAPGAAAGWRSAACRGSGGRSPGRPRR